MAINFWYASHSNEIFIDTDNYQRSIKHTCSRLLGAIKCGNLPVRKIEWHPSSTENHIHIIITLEKEFMTSVERYVWALILHSDIYRAAATIMRQLYFVPCPDILITPVKFSREPDDFCACTTKHDARTMEQCEAAIRLRGRDRIKGFFGKPEITDWNLDDINIFVQSNQKLFE